MRSDSPATKADLADLRSAIQTDLRAFKNDTVDHFNVIVEQLRHDLIGIHRDNIEVISDRTQDHEVRIRRLERSAGVAA